MSLSEARGASWSVPTEPLLSIGFCPISRLLIYWSCLGIFSISSFSETVLLFLSFLLYNLLPELDLPRDLYDCFEDLPVFLAVYWFISLGFFSFLKVADSMFPQFSKEAFLELRMLSFCLAFIAFIFGTVYPTFALDIVDWLNDFSSAWSVSWLINYTPFLG